MKNLQLIALFLGLSQVAAAWTLVAPGLSGWASRDLEIHYNFDECNIPESSLHTALDAALGSWNTAQNSSLRLTKATSPSAFTVADFSSPGFSLPLVVVCDDGFSANQTVDGDTVPAVTRLAGDQGYLTFAAVILNAEPGKAVEIANLSPTHLEITLAHEMGHMLGLGHSGDPTALMYFSISNKSASVLTQDDMDAMAYLYPRNEFTGAPFGCAVVPRARAGEAAGYWLGMVLLALGIGRWVGASRSRQI